MSTYGQNAPVFGLTGNLGRKAGTIASGGAGARYKVGGVTVDWNAVPALAADFVIPQEGRTVKAGQKYLRYGVVLCQITGSKKFAPYTIAMAADSLNGGVVAGATALTLTNGVNVNPGDTLNIAAGGGTAENIIVSAYNAGTKVASLVSPLAYLHNTATAVTKPDDGRQTLSRGYCFIADHTMVLGQDLESDHALQAYDGGPVYAYITRIASDFSGGVSTNPTKAQMDTAFPSLSWVVD